MILADCQDLIHSVALPGESVLLHDASLQETLPAVKYMCWKIYLSKGFTPCEGGAEETQGLACPCWTLKQSIVFLQRSHDLNL